MTTRGGGPTLAMVGATGAVGRTVLQAIALRQDVWGEIRLAASPDDAGTRLQVRGEELVVQPLRDSFFEGVDVAMFDLPTGMATMWAPVAVSRGAVVVDNSIDFRRDPEVPMVAPEVNASRIMDRPRGIVANPGATTLTIIDALGVLHAGWQLTELVLTTLQAASGRGRAGMGRLYDEIALVGSDRSLGQSPGDVRRTVEHELGPSVFPAPLALNVIPFVGSAAADGWTSEETKVRHEVRKVLALPDLKVSVTCVRVPVVTTHSVAVHARFARAIDVHLARQALVDAPTVVVLDDPDHGEFPTPTDAVGSDPRFAGRMRHSSDFGNAIDFFICGDNLRSGAALTMLNNAELVATSLARPQRRGSESTVTGS